VRTSTPTRAGHRRQRVRPQHVIDSPGLTKPFARVESERTGIVLEVATDLPGVQFYGGSNMGGGTGEKGSAPYVRRGALCLETQFYPDAPHANFPSSLFKAGEPFESTSIYRFPPPVTIGGNDTAEVHR
jgi:aldose 1-epimerase